MQKDIIKLLPEKLVAAGLKNHDITILLDFPKPSEVNLFHEDDIGTSSLPIKDKKLNLKTGIYHMQDKQDVYFCLFKKENLYYYYWNWNFQKCL